MWLEWLFMFAFRCQPAQIDEPGQDRGDYAMIHSLKAARVSSQRCLYTNSPSGAILPINSRHNLMCENERRQYVITLLCHGFRSANLTVYSSFFF